MGDMYWDGEKDYKSQEPKKRKKYLNRFEIFINLNKFEISEGLSIIDNYILDSQKDIIYENVNGNHRVIVYNSENDIPNSIKTKMYLSANEHLNKELEKLEKIQNLKKNKNIQKALRESKLKRII